MPYKIKTNKGGKFCVVNAETGAEVNCHADKAKALRQLRAISANEKAALVADVAKVIGSETLHPMMSMECHDPECERAFLGQDFDTAWGRMVEHAEAVHTFEDIRRLVSEVVREKYGKPGDYSKKPPVPTTWVWIDDLASDWVVFSVEKGSDMKLMKASYAIADSKVTLGDPVEVRRRTVYDTVKED